MKILDYLKYIGLFFIFIIVISFFTALINLTSINSIILTKISIILTSLSFFIISTIASKKSPEKGYILGIKLGLLMVLILIIVNLIFFRSKINIDRIIYYIILIISSILGGSFGKNIKRKLIK